jgi:uncharacterized protein (DUF4415 family)
MQIISTHFSRFDWFQTKQGSARGYQTQINAALRKLMDAEQQKAG